jgi:hypothetical protein
MPKQDYYKDVERIAMVSTDLFEQCKHCSEQIGGGDQPFSESVNHYIQKHDYKILHVGTDTSRDTDGNPWQSTVAVLGRDY